MNYQKVTSFPSDHKRFDAGLFSFPGQCQVKADVALIVDGSNSISVLGYQATKQKDYFKETILAGVKDIIDGFPVSKDETHIALMLFGAETPEVSFVFSLCFWLNCERK